MGAKKKKKKKQCYERAASKNEPGLFFIIGFFIVRHECLLETTLRNLLLGLFCLVEVRFFPFVLSFNDHG